MEAESMTRNDVLKKLEMMNARMDQLEQMLEEKLKNERNSIMSAFAQTTSVTENSIQYLELVSDSTSQRVS